MSKTKKKKDSSVIPTNDKSHKTPKAPMHVPTEEVVANPKTERLWKILFWSFAALILVCMLIAAPRTGIAGDECLDGLNGKYSLEYYANGDTSSNYNFVWAGDVFEVTVDDVKAQAAAIEENIRTTLEANGISLDSFTVGDPYDATLNDVPCIALEFQMDISAFGMTMTVYQREILVGSIGYTITISAMTPDSLDEMTQLMADALNM